MNSENYVKITSVIVTYMFKRNLHLQECDSVCNRKRKMTKSLLETLISGEGSELNLHNNFAFLNVYCAFPGNHN